MRKRFVLKGYLGEPLQQNELASVNNNISNPNLPNFSSPATANFVIYVYKVTQEEMYHQIPIYVAEEENNHYLNLENLTNREIKSKILKTIESLDDDNKYLMKGTSAVKLKGKAKTVMLIVFIT